MCVPVKDTCSTFFPSPNPTTCATTEITGYSQGTTVVYIVGNAITDNVPTISLADGTPSNNAGERSVAYSVSPALPAGLIISTVAPKCVCNGVPVNHAADGDIGHYCADFQSVGFAWCYVDDGVCADQVLSPNGLNFWSKAVCNQGVISGTPTVGTATAAYVVTATNSAGDEEKTTITITVKLPSGKKPVITSYTVAAATYPKGVAIADNTPTLNMAAGDAPTGYAVAPELPAGLAIHGTTGVISGTPTIAAAAATYTVSASNEGGTGTIDITIAVQLRAPQLIKDIDTLVSPWEGVAKSLATASAAKKKEAVAGIVDALSSAVANASNIDGPSGGSQIVLVLENITNLAGSIDVAFDVETTGKIMNTISTVLDVRGSAAPDSAMDKIDTIIRKLVANNPAAVIAVKTDRVALVSATTNLSFSSSPPSSSASSPSQPQLGSGLLSSFSSIGTGASTESGSGLQGGNSSYGANTETKWQQTVANMSIKDALVALDGPTKVQFFANPDLFAVDHGDRRLSTTPTLPPAEVQTTLVQYSGGRNPYWPSPFSSSDIITLTITSGARRWSKSKGDAEGRPTGRRQLENGGDGGASSGGGSSDSGNVNSKKSAQTAAINVTFVTR